eukprot:scpid46878/ scgid33706/ 
MLTTVYQCHCRTNSWRQLCGIRFPGQGEWHFWKIKTVKDQCSQVYFCVLSSVCMYSVYCSVLISIRMYIVYCCVLSSIRRCTAVCLDLIMFDLPSGYFK